MADKGAGLFIGTRRAFLRQAEADAFLTNAPVRWGGEADKPFQRDESGELIGAYSVGIPYDPADAPKASDRHEAAIDGVGTCPVCGSWGATQPGPEASQVMAAHLRLVQGSPFVPPAKDGGKGILTELNWCTGAGLPPLRTLPEPGPRLLTSSEQ